MTTELLHADWCPMDLNHEVIAPKRGSISDRSPSELTEVIAQFADQARYAHRDVTGDHIDETMCNFFVREVVRNLGCDMPRMRANDMFDWLSVSNEWSRVQPWIARTLAAKAGVPVIVAWKNLAGGPGHVGIVVPSRSELDRETTFIAQAGSSNFIYGRLSEGFGARPVLFYAHP